MRSRKLVWITTILVITVLLGAACGGGGQEPAPGDSGNGTAEVPGDPENGKELYMGTCVSCHGPDAKGIKGLGKDLTDSEFVQTNTPEELVDFLKEGRAAGDPLNDTGVDMPPKGGNPALTDEDLVDITAYLKSLQPE